MRVARICQPVTHGRWVGLPSNTQSEFQDMLELEVKLRERIERKKRSMQELVLQARRESRLVTCSRAAADCLQEPCQVQRAAAGGGGLGAAAAVYCRQHGPQHHCGVPDERQQVRMHMLIRALTLCARSEYFFNFDAPFEIHDDIEILRRMGLTFGLGTGACGPCTPAVRRVE